MSQKPNSGGADWEALTPVSKVDVLEFRVQRVEQDVSALASTVDELAKAQAATTARLDGLATREQVAGIPAAVASMIRAPSSAGSASTSSEEREDAAKWRVVKPWIVPLVVGLLAGGGGGTMIARVLAHEASAPVAGSK